MVCIYCGGKTSVANSRSRAKGLNIWRRRRCDFCGAIYTSNESVDLQSSIRVKKGSSLKPFLYEKLLLDVYYSIEHRKTAYKDAKWLTDTIIFKLLPCKTGILQKEEINNAALEVLKHFDKAAFAYFKAHHSTS